MTAPYLGSTGVVRTPRRIICFKASWAARFRAASVPYAWRSVCFVRSTTSGCLVRARPAWVRPTLKGASALRKRAVGSIRYATLLLRTQLRYWVGETITPVLTMANPPPVPAQPQPAGARRSSPCRDTVPRPRSMRHALALGGPSGRRGCPGPGGSAPAGDACPALQPGRGPGSSRLRPTRSPEVRAAPQCRRGAAGHMPGYRVPGAYGRVLVPARRGRAPPPDGRPASASPRERDNRTPDRLPWPVLSLA